MAGVGANFVLDKGWPVLSTYNSSAAAGVVAFRCVGFGAGGTIDINATATARSVGVVQENIDQVDVATGKAVANVRMMGITTVLCTTAASVVLGSLVAPTTSGGVKLAATTNVPIGVVVGITGTLADGNLIQVLLTPGIPALA
jgi:hypothetical protein